VMAELLLNGARPKRVSPVTPDVAPPVRAHPATTRTRVKSSDAVMARDVQLRMLP